MCWCTEWRFGKVTDCRGQATVEAAFLIPLLFICLLLLIQPGIILYDRMVMQGAAADGCRMLATHGPDVSDERCRQLIMRHLGSVPQQSLFHVHEGACSWQVFMQGSETAETVSVRITNKVRLLPLFDVTATLLGIADDRGCMNLEVSCSQPTQPSWVAQSQSGLNPQAWVDGREEA